MPNKITNFDRMTAGKFYNPTDAGILLVHLKALSLCDKYNKISVYNLPKRNHLIKKLIPNQQDGTFILNDFHCEYGVNITLGKNFFANFDCKMLDVAPIKIGDNVMLGPNVTIATPMHPLVADERIIQEYPNGTYDLEYASPITIEDNVWIATGAIVCGGVTIGKNSVIAAGSVVTRDVPEGVLAGGVPAKIIRNITDADRMHPLDTYNQNGVPTRQGTKR